MMRTKEEINQLVAAVERVYVEEQWPYRQSFIKGMFCALKWARGDGDVWSEMILRLHEKAKPAEDGTEDTE